MVERTTRAGGSRAARAVLPWLGVGIGVVLLVRLVAQGVRAAGYGAAWLDDLVLGELVSGLRFSVVDVVIVLVAAAVGIGSVVAAGGGRDDLDDGR